MSLLYQNIFDISIRFFAFFRNNGLLSIKFFCVTLPHMSIGSRVVLAVTFQKVDNAPDTKACAQGHYESLQNTNCTVEKFHKVLTFCRLFCGTQNKNYSSAFSSDRSISYRSKLSSCATTCCRFRRRVDKNLSTSKVFFLSASARYL